MSTRCQSSLCRSSLRVSCLNIVRTKPLVHRGTEAASRTGEPVPGTGPRRAKPPRAPGAKGPRGAGSPHVSRTPRPAGRGARSRPCRGPPAWGRSRQNGDGRLACNPCDLAWRTELLTQATDILQHSGITFYTFTNHTQWLLHAHKHTHTHVHSARALHVGGAGLKVEPCFRWQIMCFGSQLVAVMRPI